VSSTLHQCLKYVDNDTHKRINGDLKPFEIHEIKFNDAQLFISEESKKKNDPSESAKALRDTM
jgi:hypothetical protein